MARRCESIQLESTSGLVLGTTITSTVTSTATTDRTINLPDASTTLIGSTDAAVLTNKTITSTSNTVAAQSLHTTTGVVTVSGSAAPTVGQTLIATSSTTATWQTISDPGTSNTTGTVTTTNNTITNIETLATADNTVYYVTSYIAGRRTDTAGTGGGYTIKRAFRRATGAASLTAIGVDDIVSNEDNTNWSVSTNANTTTGDIEIRVQGDTGQTVNWKSATTTVSV